MRPKTQGILDWLRRFESRNVTFLDPDGSWPIVWDRAKGNYVWDVDGRKYLDLTAAFGVAAAGHANPRVVRAGQRQMGKLLHAMGDVHPHALKARLARELSRITFERWHRQSAVPGAALPAGSRDSAHGKVVFCNSGFEAVEAALKTAILATGKREVIAFRGGYHGLGYGALNATYREHFRGPFLPQLGGFGHFAAFPRNENDLPELEKELSRLFRRGTVGAVLVEPVQVRGGIHVSPPGFLPLLKQMCLRHKALLILDEIYTGCGRTGRWFACEHWGVTPDIICLGKGLTGGFPLSACVGRAELMDRVWPASTGEAIHTSTFLGHPVGCAMALAQIEEIADQQLPRRAAALGKRLIARLEALPPLPGSKCDVRGLGLLAGIEVRSEDGSPATSTVLTIVKRMLSEGMIILPEGDSANVLAFTPPLTIKEPELDRAVSVLQTLLKLSKGRT